jgi:hypothetical protein
MFTLPTFSAMLIGWHKSDDLTMMIKQQAVGLFYSSTPIRRRCEVYAGIHAR